MRTLKKTLCLVLVLAMVLGLTVNAFAATKFPDDAAIEHGEAAAVISAIGVLQGFDDGMFHPERNMNRAQAATFITRLLGREGIPGRSTFEDMQASQYDWAQPYVAFCQTEGIVTGVDDKHFEPDREVTGYEFAKMLLVALGYDADREGMAHAPAGTIWYNNVASIMMLPSNRLNKGLATGFDYSVPINRDNAAQMIFNTLTATMVGYDGAFDLTLGDAILSFSGQAKAIAGETAAADSYDQTTAGGVLTTGLQLCEKFFPELLKVDNTGEPQDDFARPNDYGWEYDGEAVIYMPQSNVVSWSKAVKEADVKKVLSAYTPDVAWEVFVNGDQKNGSGNAGTVVDAGVEFYSGFNLADGSKIDYKGIADLTGNGRCVEIYVDSANKKVTDVVVIEFTVGKIDSITEKNNGDVEYTVKNDNGGTQTGVIDADDADENTVVLGGDFVKDDIVTYAVGEGGLGDDVLYIYPTTMVTGNQTATTQNTQRGSGKVTISGNDEYTIGDAVLWTSDFRNTQNTDKENEFYLDQFGFLVYAKEVASETNYAVVLRIAKPAGGLASAKAVAKLLFTDGTTKDVTVAAKTGNTGFDKTALDGLDPDYYGHTNNKNYCGMIVTYTTNSDGEYVLKNANDITDSTGVVASSVSNTSTGNTGKTIITQKGTPKFTHTATTSSAATDDWGSGTKVATSKTIFLVATGDDANTDGVITSYESTSDTYAAYVGYANVPDLRLLPGDANSSVTNYASVSYVETVANGVEIVFIDLGGSSTGSSTESKDIFYASSGSVKSTGEGSNAIYSLAGYINGESKTIESKTKSILDDAVRGNLYKVTYNSDGYVTKLEDVTLYPVTAEAKNGVLGTTNKSDWAYDDSITAWLIDNGDYTIAKKGITDAKLHYNTYIIPKDETKAPGDGQIDTIYIIKVDASVATLKNAGAVTFGNTTHTAGTLTGAAIVFPSSANGRVLTAGAAIDTAPDATTGLGGKITVTLPYDLVYSAGDTVKVDFTNALPSTEADIAVKDFSDEVFASKALTFTAQADGSFKSGTVAKPKVEVTSADGNKTAEYEVEIVHTGVLTANGLTVAGGSSYVVTGVSAAIDNSYKITLTYTVAPTSGQTLTAVPTWSQGASAPAGTSYKLGAAQGSTTPPTTAGPKYVENSGEFELDSSDCADSITTVSGSNTITYTFAIVDNT